MTNQLWLFFESCELALCMYFKKVCCCWVIKLCLTLCDPMDYSMPGSPVLHYLLEFAETHVHWVYDAIQPSYPLLSPSPPVFNLSQHHGLFQWVGSSYQVAKILELQHQSFQRIFRVDFLYDWLVWSPWESPRDSQESSAALQLEGINSSAYRIGTCLHIGMFSISQYLRLS